MRIKILDYIIILLVVIVSIISFNFLKKINLEYVEIYTPYKKFVLPLKVNKTIKIKGKIGYITLEIKDKMVRIVKSGCPNKLCVKTGWISKSNEYIACVPNKILIKLSSKKENKKYIDFITK